jgi:hypothetical protein
MCGANKSGVEGMGIGAVEKANGIQSSETNNRLNSGDRLFSLGYNWSKMQDWKKSEPKDIGQRQGSSMINNRSLLR